MKIDPSLCFSKCQNLPKVSDDTCGHVHFMHIKFLQHHTKMGWHEQNHMPFQNMYFANALVSSATPYGKKSNCLMYYTEPLVSLFTSKSTCNLY